MSNLKKILTILALVLFTASGVYSEEARQVPEGPGTEGAENTFNSGRFQAAVNGDRSVGAVAGENSVVGQDASAFGFAEKSEEAKFFLIGSIYSEALAHLLDGDTEKASERLTMIRKELINLNVPNSLFNYISKTNNLIKTKRYEKDVLFDFLSLFQPFFEDYAKSQSEDKLILFRAGSWLMDMGLAAAAGDKNILNQPEKLNYFITEMKRMDAPKGVINALEDIGEVASMETITDRDAEKVLKLVKKIQTILG